MRRYAQETTVPVERSRAEIERLVSQYGADQFASMWGDNRSMIMFRAKTRMIRFTLILPAKDAKELLRDGRGCKRTPERMYQAWEQVCRQLWRALALNIKAKLEAVEAKISTFEAEFMPYTVLPDGKTVQEWIEPQLADMYATGKMPKMLPGIGETGGMA